MSMQTLAQIYRRVNARMLAYTKAKDLIDIRNLPAYISEDGEKLIIKGEVNESGREFEYLGFEYNPKTKRWVWEYKG